MSIVEREEFRIVKSGEHAEVKKVSFEDGYEREINPSKKELLEIVQLVLSKVPR
ncbi:hypothetical protein SAMN02745945_01806 [Peptoclostridium litorale DSM 5388]|uniref:Uncharacterized protein n=1 Tax=Peptoclostridium litorale DSM 5388 TaxID=1121324 RepID=A0A069RIE6_PEPLI|nr:hypothetical protein CLIT_8c00890 [Peptoclostridium litorale DSM 5388]SIO09952.1 hypothetical protein SAMN02745945_01806 [Peptoclostridium litorale DSM 5388]